MLGLQVAAASLAVRNSLLYFWSAALQDTFIVSLLLF